MDSERAAARRLLWANVPSGEHEALTIRESNTYSRRETTSPMHLTTLASSEALSANAVSMTWLPFAKSIKALVLSYTFLSRMTILYFGV